MYLLGHNATLTAITAPGVPDDPTKGITGSSGTVRWSGYCQAYVDEDIVDEIRGGMRIQISQTIVDLPVNLPVWPNQEDTITVKRLPGLVPYAQGWPAQYPQTESLIVRKTDGGLVMLGKLRVYVVRGAPVPS